MFPIAHPSWFCCTNYCVLQLCIPARSKYRQTPCLPLLLEQQEYFFAAVYYESLMNTISAPLNMPPRYAEFSKGRVLVGFNTSSQNVDTPWLRDDRKDVAIASDYWDNPAASDELGKELKDTFHEVCPFGWEIRQKLRHGSNNILKPLRGSVASSFFYC